MTISKLKTGYKFEDKLNFFLLNPEKSELEDNFAFILSTQTDNSYKQIEYSKLITTSGEYEIKDMSVYAYDLLAQDKIVLAKIIVENCSILYVSEQVNDIEKSLVEEIGEVNIMILEIGNKSLHSKKAELIQEIEPNFVILNDLESSLKDFEKEYGSNAEVMKKLKVKAEDFDNDDVSVDTKLVVME